MGNMAAGDMFIWKEKRVFEFLEKIGPSYYFTCPDYFGAGDAGVVCLPARDLKYLVRVSGGVADGSEQSMQVMQTGGPVLHAGSGEQVGDVGVAGR